MPGAEEVISYKMPTYKLDGHAVLYLAGWKKHYSLYPCTGNLEAAFKDELAPYEVLPPAGLAFARVVRVKPGDQHPPHGSELYYGPTCAAESLPRDIIPVAGKIQFPGI